MCLDDYSKGMAATLLGALLWSTGGLFIKLLPQDAWTILFYRSFFAALLFGLVFRQQILHTNRQMWINSLLYAALLVTFVTSTKLTTAANAIFLQYTGTAYVLLLEPLLFKTRLRRIDLWTMLLCFAGMALFFFEKFDASGGLGIAIAMLSGLLLAALFLGQKRNPPEYRMSAIFWGNIWVAIIGFSAFWGAALPSTTEWAMLLFLGFIQIGTGYLLFTYGQRFIPATESALLAMVEPILNPVWVLIGYGEQPAAWAIVGGFIIIGALVGRIILLRRLSRRTAHLRTGVGT